VDLGQESPSVIVRPPGPKSRALAERLSRVESPAFDARRDARADVSGEDQGSIFYASAIGSNVIDVDGNRYVDFAAGFGALPLGHRAKNVQDAINRAQGDLWLALGDVYSAESKVTLCEKLAALYPEGGARVLLGLSGADAMTAAMKTAMLATGRAGVIAFEASYHGLSYGPLAACGLNAAFREPFREQLGSHVTFAPYPKSESELASSLSIVRAAMASGNIGAVLIEPIVGRGGCIVPPKEFLASLRAICDDAGALLIADEIWTGLGRSGSWLASVAAGVVPDVICVGKGLGSGLPISACIGSERVMKSWGKHGGSAIHTATHFGAPIACAAAIATIDELTNEKIVARSAHVGQAWMQSMRARLVSCGANDVRGRGMMIGIAVDGGASRALAVTRDLLARGYIVLTGGVRGDVITLTPPLTIAESLLDEFTTALEASLRAV
jgi:4-aminobutyrate aminotransferase/(S)-3-amino-2-methylpropionate transaminase